METEAIEKGSWILLNYYVPKKKGIFYSDRYLHFILAPFNVHKYILAVSTFSKKNCDTFWKKKHFGTKASQNAVFRKLFPGGNSSAQKNTTLIKENNY